MFVEGDTSAASVVSIEGFPCTEGAGGGDVSSGLSSGVINSIRGRWSDVQGWWSAEGDVLVEEDSSYTSSSTQPILANRSSEGTTDAGMV